MSQPKIFVFSNSSDGDGLAIAMAEDGECLATHFSSSEYWAYHDLTDFNFRTDIEPRYAKKYPDGYQFEQVLIDEVKTHPGLVEAYRLNQILGEEAKKKGETR